MLDPSPAASAQGGGPPDDIVGVGISAVAGHVHHRWEALSIAAAIVVVAFLVNRYAPAKRLRIRRTVILVAFRLITLGIAAALQRTGPPIWAERFTVASDLFSAFAWVNLTALALFDLALPKLAMQVSSITVDLTIGLAYIITTLGVLSAAGMNPSSVIATSAVVSGILALSLQATLGNILGGVALQLDGSIHVGDWLQFDNGKQARVRQIRWRHTVLETRDYDTLVVPNASLLGSTITILGKRGGLPAPHRCDVFFHVDFRYSPSAVITAVQDAIRSAPIDKVAGDPPPQVICYDLAKDGRDSYGYYSARFFLTDMSAVESTSSVIRTRIYMALRRASIPLARPARTVFFTAEDERAEAEKNERQREKRMKVIASLEIFKALTEDEVCFLAEHLQPVPYAPNERITRQGAVAHWLYVLRSGRAEIRMNVPIGGPPPAGTTMPPRAPTDGPTQTKVVAILEAPAVFGEMGMMTGEPRSADVVATTEVECYRLDKTAFEKVLRDRPEVATELSETLARRRLELAAARDGVDASVSKKRQATEAAQILHRIQTFFGLDPEDRKSTLGDP